MRLRPVELRPRPTAALERCALRTYDRRLTITLGSLEERGPRFGYRRHLRGRARTYVRPRSESRLTIGSDPPPSLNSERDVPSEQPCRVHVHHPAVRRTDEVHSR